MVPKTPAHTVPSLAEDERYLTRPSSPSLVEAHAPPSSETRCFSRHAAVPSSKSVSSRRSLTGISNACTVLLSSSSVTVQVTVKVPAVSGDIQ